MILRFSGCAQFEASLKGPRGCKIVMQSHEEPEFKSTHRVLVQCLGGVIVLALTVIVLLAAYPDVPPWFVRGGHIESEIERFGKVQTSFVTSTNSDETEFPYSNLSASQRDRWLYQAAIWLRPDTRSCLKVHQSDDTALDLSKFDWGSMYTESMLNVCLFRVMNSLQEPGHVVSWLRSQGFETGRLRKGTVLGKSVMGLNAGRTLHYERGPKWPTWGFTRWLTWSISHAETVGVTWSLEGRLISVDYGVTTL